MKMHIYDEQTGELALGDGRIVPVPADWLENDSDPVECVRGRACEEGLIDEADLLVALGAPG